MIWVSLFLFLISLLSVFKAPAEPLWLIAIGATEWGHFLAIGSIMFAMFNWRMTRRWELSSSAALAAAVLYLTPLARASIVARRLPEDLVVQFGNVMPRGDTRAPARPRPLDIGDLFSGVSSPGVRVSNVVYAIVHGEALSLDLYRPLALPSPQGESTRVRGFPGLIVVHGGSWQGGARTEITGLNRYLAARGYLVASIDYRLAPRSVFPAQRDDVFAAIAYLKDHAKEIGLDKDHLVLLGRSAGGQIALSAAYAETDAAIKGVIVFYAPNDLVWGYANPANPLIMNSRQVIETYLGGAPSQIPAAYEASSPLRQVNKDTPPTLMIHGERDELVSPTHEERLSRRLLEEGRPYYYLTLPWATHGCDANFSGPSGQLSTYAIERFLAFVIR